MTRLFVGARKLKMPKGKGKKVKESSVFSRFDTDLRVRDSSRGASRQIGALFGGGR